MDKQKPLVESGAARMSRVEDTVTTLQAQCDALQQQNAQLTEHLRFVMHTLVETLPSTSMVSPAARWDKCRRFVEQLKQHLTSYS